MEELQGKFNKLPNWLRYVLFLPTGFLSMFVIYIIAYLSLLIYASPDSVGYAIIKYLIINFLEIFVAVYVMYMMLPKYKYTIMLIFVTLYCLLSLLLMFNPEMIIPAILNIIASIMGLVMVKKNEIE